MTWTYSDTDLSTDLAKVRLKIGDVDTNDQLLTDEEIAYVLANYTGLDLAAVECLKIILAAPEAARAVDRSGTGFSATRSQRFQHLRDLLAELQAKASTSASPSLMGTSQSEQDSLDADTDYIQPSFIRGLHDNS